MKIRSFRVRIAMLSVLCSSLVLVGSAMVAWQIVWRSELLRADRFITKVVLDNITHGFHPPPGSRPSAMPFGPMGGDRDPRRFDRRGGRGNRPDWMRGPDNPDGSDASRGPEGRMPWRRPAWQRPPGMRDDSRETSEPASLFQYQDLAEKFESHSENWPTTQTIHGLVIPTDGSVQIGTFALQGALWRIGAGGNAESSMVFGINLDPAVAIIEHVASAFLFSIPVALVLIALGAVFMARRALRPVHDLTALVERMTAHGLSERIESRVKDAEFEKLIQVFNQMMGRLERSFTQANRFSADAAHELRTPITVLQGHVERMLHDAEPGSAMQQGLGDMVDELHRVKSILEKLLLLARMDAGEFQVRLTPQDLSGMVESIVEDIQAVAPGIAVESRIEPGLRVAGDAAMLETAIQNVGGNAVKYNLDGGGWIGVELRRQKETALLAISNTGPKIAREDREKIFDRFYRADKARSRETDGLGLGLSLAREIVQAHHGAMRLVESGGAVNRFEIELPLCAGE